MKPYSRHQIETLLDKFMAGKTTIEEESLHFARQIYGG